MSPSAQQDDRANYLGVFKRTVRYVRLELPQQPAPTHSAPPCSESDPAHRTFRRPDRFSQHWSIWYRLYRWQVNIPKLFTEIHFWGASKSLDYLHFMFYSLAIQREIWTLTFSLHNIYFIALLIVFYRFSYSVTQITLDFTKLHMRRTEAFYTIHFINQKDLFATFETWDNNNSIKVRSTWSTRLIFPKWSVFINTLWISLKSTIWSGACPCSEVFLQTCSYSLTWALGLCTSNTKDLRRTAALALFWKKMSVAHQL